MKDFAKNSPTHYQSVNDLTFVSAGAEPKPYVTRIRSLTASRPTIIRRSHLAARDEHGNYQRSFVDPVILRRPSQNATQRLADSAAAGHAVYDTLKRKPAATSAGAIGTMRRPVWKAILAGQPVRRAQALLQSDWRVLISDKHKKYSADKGIQVQPKSFRTQGGVLVLLLALSLASAQLAAPAQPQPPVQPSAGGATPAAGPDREASFVTTVRRADPSVMDNGATSRSSQPSRPANTSTASVGAVYNGQPQTGHVPVTADTNASDPPASTGTPATNTTDPVVGSPAPGSDPNPSDPASEDDNGSGDGSGDAGNGGSSDSGDNSAGPVGTVVEGVGNTLGNGVKSATGALGGLLGDL